MNRKRVDRTGQRYGDMIVIDRGEVIKGHQYFNCKCDCGENIAISHNSLKNRHLKKTKACPLCPQRNRGKNHPSWKGFGDISKTFFDRYKREGIKRGYNFDITIEYGWDLFCEQKGKCAYSDLQLYFPSDDEGIHRTNVSLDRIDSSKGYEIGNVQWVHRAINHLKCQIPHELFIQTCNLVAIKNKREPDMNYFENNYKCIIKTTFKMKKGKEHHMSKSYHVLYADGRTEIFKGLADFCQKNNISYHSARVNIKNNKPTNGFLITNMNKE